MNIESNILVFEANSQPFESIFGLCLRDYYSFLTGFEIVQFCSEVLKGHPQDWEQEVRAKYDQEGVDIIKDLLGIQEEHETITQPNQDRTYSLQSDDSGIAE